VLDGLTRTKLISEKVCKGIVERYKDRGQLSFVTLKLTLFILTTIKNSHTKVYDALNTITADKIDGNVGDQTFSVPDTKEVDHSSIGSTMGLQMRDKKKSSHSMQLLEDSENVSALISPGEYLTHYRFIAISLLTVLRSYQMT